MKKFLALTLALLLAVSLLTACGGNNSGTPDGSTDGQNIADDSHSGDNSNANGEEITVPFPYDFEITSSSASESSGVVFTPINSDVVMLINGVSDGDLQIQENTILSISFNFDIKEAFGATVNLAVLDEDGNDYTHSSNAEFGVNDDFQIGVLIKPKGDVAQKYLVALSFDDAVVFSDWMDVEFSDEQTENVKSWE